MKSHEYAVKLQELAGWLLSKDDFETDGRPYLSLWYWSNKEDFLASVKALGAGKKEYDSDSVKFRFTGAPEGVEVYAKINRDRVCRKVQDAVWECEPLLSEDEEKVLV